jgi:hypothetical protein
MVKLSVVTLRSWYACIAPGGLVIATLPSPAIASLELDAMLADALAFNWSDLMPELTSGLIHVEYHVEPRGSVEFMKVWASTTRGHWDLVCEYFVRSGASGKSGLRFANGYKSEGLERMLESIMQHPEIFLVGTPPGTDRMIQVPPPTKKDTLAASGMMEAFRDRLAT